MKQKLSGQLITAWFTVPLFCIHIFILAHEPKSKASGSMEERNMFPARQHWCKPGTSPTHELPAPSHFALQRWHVYLLFFPFSSLPASLYTPNCAESFDGGWEESERRVEEKRNWALTLIRWSSSKKKKKKKMSAPQHKRQYCQSWYWGWGQLVEGGRTRRVHSCGLRNEGIWWE